MEKLHSRRSDFLYIKSTKCSYLEIITGKKQEDSIKKKKENLDKLLLKRRMKHSNL
jgi:hypothetical protein